MLTSYNWQEKHIAQEKYSLCSYSALIRPNRDYDDYQDCVIVFQNDNHLGQKSRSEITLFKWQ